MGIDSRELENGVDRWKTDAMDTKNAPSKWKNWPHKARGQLVSIRIKPGSQALCSAGKAKNVTAKGKNQTRESENETTASKPSTSEPSAVFGQQERNRCY